MHGWRLTCAGLLGFVLLANGPADAPRLDQARANYEALIAGRKQIGQLTPQERADVMTFSQALGATRDTRSPSQRCIDRETARLGGRPSDLDRRVIDMTCRDLGQPL